MTVWQGIFLGVIQGLTEFLPVSSSGHLVFFQNLLAINSPGITFEIFAHFGSVLAVILIYRNRLWRLLKGFFAGLATVAAQGNHGPEPAAYREAWALILATAVTGVMGLVGEPLLEPLFDSTVWVGLFWLVTGVILWWLGRRPLEGMVEPGDLGPGKAAGIGLSQGLALAPGLSRSGLTIAGGVAVGMGQEEAAHFSFILSVPAILGVVALDLVELVLSPGGVFMSPPVLAGMLAAFISGYAAIHLFVGLIRRRRLHLFAYYLWVMGLLVLFLNV